MTNRANSSKYGRTGLLLALSLLASVGACGDLVGFVDSGDSDFANDSGPDAGADAGTFLDGGALSGTDSGSGTGYDSGVGEVVESAADSGENAVVDAGSQAEPVPEPERGAVEAFGTLLPQPDSGIVDTPEFDAGHEELDARFVELDGGREELDGGFEKLDGKFEELDGGFEEPDARREELDGGFEELDGGSEELDGGSEELDGSIEIDAGVVESEHQDAGSTGEEPPVIFVGNESEADSGTPDAAVDAGVLEVANGCGLGGPCVPESQVCVAGRCEAIHCSDVHLCDPASQYCSGGSQCLPVLCAGVSCSEVEQCVGGVCVPKSCPAGATSAVSLVVCAEAGQFCDVGTNTCADANCTRAVTCSNGKYCSNGKCLPCTADENCAFGQVCMRGACSQRPVIGETCEKPGDCVDTLCAPAPRNICVKNTNAHCVEDSECRHACVDNKCLAQKRVTGDSCTLDSQCPSAHACVVGSNGTADGKLACFKRQGEACNEDSECRHACVDNKCLAQKRVTGDSCTLDSQCPSAHACALASSSQSEWRLACVKELGEVCAESTECKSNSCISGVCSPCVAGVVCSTNRNQCRKGISACMDERLICEDSNERFESFKTCRNLDNKFLNLCIQGECSVRTFNLTISSDRENFDLFTEMTAQDREAMRAKVPMYARIVVEKGVTISSNGRAPAMALNRLPAKSIVHLVNLGRIVGAGGNGGTGAQYFCETERPIGGMARSCKQTNATRSTPGTHAIVVGNDFNFDNARGEVMGGGGGGGGGGAVFQTISSPDCGAFSATASGGGGGGGAGFIATGGAGWPPPPWRATDPTAKSGSGAGRNGSVLGAGSGGARGEDKRTNASGTCVLNSIGGAGGAGGDWGKPGNDGEAATNLNSTDGRTFIFVHPSAGSPGGNAIFRENNSTITWMGSAAGVIRGPIGPNVFPH